MLPSDIRSLAEAYQSIYAQEEIVELTEELLDESFDELVEELIEEGYEEEEAISLLEDATDDYLDEAKVTFGHDTTARRASGAPVGARRKYGKRKAGEALKAAGSAVKGAADSAKKKASAAKAGVQIAGSIAKDEARRAGRKAVHGVKHSVEKKKQEVKSGIKGFLGKAARKVASKAAGAAARLGEEAIQEADSIAAMRERAAKRRKQRYGASDTSRGGRDDFRPYTKADYERGEANDPRKKDQREELEATGLFSEQELDAIMEMDFKIDPAAHKQQQKIQKATNVQKATSGPESSAAAGAVKRLGGSGVSLPPV